MKREDSGGKDTHFQKDSDKTNTPNIEKDLDDYLDIIRVKKNGVTRERIKHLVEVYHQVDQALPKIPKIYYILNLFLRPSYEFLGKNTSAVSGHSRAYFLKKGPKFFLENLHPEDRKIVINKIYREGLKYYRKLKKHQDTFHIEYNYRFKHADGHYIKLQERVHILKNSFLGPQLIMGEVTRMEDQPDSLVKATFYYVDDEDNRIKIASRVYSDQPELDSLTARERDILQLVAQGHTNKTIAEMLNISEHTVRTHRNRVWKKLKIKHLKEAIQYADQLN